MSVLRLLNRQKVRPIDPQLFRRIARATLEESLGREKYQLGVHLVGAREMAALNEKYLGHEGSTDVITFNHSNDDQSCAHPDTSTHGRAALLRRQLIRRSGSSALPRTAAEPRCDAPPLHGEIFICIDDALIQARQFGVSWQSEVTRYLVHGLLHLEGFDDTEPALRKAMKRRENNLVNELSQRFDFRKLSRLKRDTH